MYKYLILVLIAFPGSAENCSRPDLREPARQVHEQICNYRIESAEHLTMILNRAEEYARGLQLDQADLETLQRLHVDGAFLRVGEYVLVVKHTYTDRGWYDLVMARCHGLRGQCYEKGGGTSLTSWASEEGHAEIMRALDP